MRVKKVNDSWTYKNGENKKKISLCKETVNHKFQSLSKT